VKTTVKLNQSNYSQWRCDELWHCYHLARYKNTQSYQIQVQILYKVMRIGYCIGTRYRYCVCTCLTEFQADILLILYINVCYVCSKNWTKVLSVKYKIFTEQSVNVNIPLCKLCIKYAFQISRLVLWTSEHKKIFINYYTISGSTNFYECGSTGYSPDPGQ